MAKHKPLHRDDIDPGVIQEIEAMMAKLHPGKKVVFSGDIPTTSAHSAELQRALEEADKLSRRSLENGTCLDCGAAMPNYYPEEDGWEPAEGWNWFCDIATDELRAWICPQCDCDTAEVGINPAINPIEGPGDDGTPTEN